MSSPQSNPWSVPRDHPGERGLIICGGESTSLKRHLIHKFKGPIIALKQAVAIRPDAYMMFLGGKDDGTVCSKFFPMFNGQYIVARGPYRGVPFRTKVLRRTSDPKRISVDPTQVAGYDAGTSAINVAVHLGWAEVLLIGYDMKGGRWLNGIYNHHLPYPPQFQFDAHLSALPTIAEDLTKMGVKVFNCSPVSAVQVFEKKDLEEFV